MAGSRRRWGWHQLTPDWADQLVDDAGIRRGTLVLDIGAGTGALTAPLLAAGAKVIAVEAHAGRRATLRDRFRSEVVAGRLVIVGADAADLRLPRRPFDVVANPPFSITSPLLRRLWHRGSRLRRATLVMQHQAARRAVASAPPGWEVGLGPRLPRRAFRPPPRVDCTVVRIGRPTGRGP